MKIAIATDDQVTIASHFGRTRGFMIFTVDGTTIAKEYRENSFTGHMHNHTEGVNSVDHHATIISALSDCQTVICKGMGRRIFEDLKTANIQSFVTVENDIDQALSLYMQGKLDNNPGQCCQHHGHHVC